VQKRLFGHVGVDHLPKVSVTEHSPPVITVSATPSAPPRWRMAR
jgi:hypothetical protein